MEPISIDQALRKIEQAEKNAKKRAVAFIFLPLVFAIILITYTSSRIIHAQKELDSIESKIQEANYRVNDANKQLDSIKRLNTDLKSQNDSLKSTLTETTVLLGKQVAVFTEFKKFIDKMAPANRSYKEAAFWINFRMLEDKIRGNYEDLSKKISALPELDVSKKWVVIVQSSNSLEDLKIESKRLTDIYGKDQVAIFQSKKDYYALSLIGNGTFTRAYRLNVELRDKHQYAGAYFADSTDWGINYLNQ